MTMQRGDYLRIAGVIRRTRDEAIADETDEKAIRVVHDIFYNLAINVASAFGAVNERFQVEKFIVDCLGDVEGPQAVEQYRAEKAEREERNRDAEQR